MPNIRRLCVHPDQRVGLAPVALADRQVLSDEVWVLRLVCWGSIWPNVVVKIGFHREHRRIICYFLRLF